MPTYTYKCPIHGEFEVEQRISDPKLQTCPRIMGDRLTLGRSFPCGQPVERLCERCAGKGALPPGMGVRFPEGRGERLVEYSKSKADSLALAYALTGLVADDDDADLRAGDRRVDELARQPSTRARAASGRGSWCARRRTRGGTPRSWKGCVQREQEHYRNQGRPR